MQYREVGNTGIRISEIGFGTGGNAGLMVKGDPADQLRAIECAIELGINYFDEAPDYGSGVSETNLGRALRELGVRPIITTKVEVREANLDDIASHVERSVEASLERLGVDYVDFVQIHNGPVATRPKLEGRDYRVLWIEDFLGPHGALEGLERIRSAGKTRFVGFCCRGDDGESVRQLIDTGRFNIMNVVHHLLNPTAAAPAPRGMDVSPDFGGVIPYGYERGVAAALYAPLAGGLLTDNIAGGGEPHPIAASERREQRFAQVGRASAFRFLSNQGQSLAQAALRFTLMEPGVTTALGGFSDAHQVEENAAASGAGPLTPEEMARIEMVWRASGTS
jgi:aryl-alcohol dehydrogenase-like predicted oxidoreductase